MTDVNDLEIKNVTTVQAEKIWDIMVNVYVQNVMKEDKNHVLDVVVKGTEAIAMNVKVEDKLKCNTTNKTYMKQFKRGFYIAMYFGAGIAVFAGMLIFKGAFDGSVSDDLKRNILINISQEFLLGGLLYFILITLWKILDVLKSKSEND